MELITIPENIYENYKYEVIFNAYKWDPQVGDHNTVARHILLIDEAEAKTLENFAMKLSVETSEAENYLINNLEYTKKLDLPKNIIRSLKLCTGYNPDKHIRIMRFDLHPTEDGLALSEVNSDVPGGFAEASVLPEIAASNFHDYYSGRNFGDILTAELTKLGVQKKSVALVHCTAYSDDRQVMQFLGDHFIKSNITPVYAAPDHIKFMGNNAYSVIGSKSERIDGIIRFFPFEWLRNLPGKTDYKSFFTTNLLSANHPVSMLTQTKRFPLIWNDLEEKGLKFETWRRLLPVTLDPKEKSIDETFIYKPALGRVGEDISIKGTMPEKEYKKILKDVRRHPRSYVAQKLFKSKPIMSYEGKEYHLCIGVFTINNKPAGFYGRLSGYPRIDLNALDIPILIKRS